VTALAFACDLITRFLFSNGVAMKEQHQGIGS